MVTQLKTESIKTIRILIDIVIRKKKLKPNGYVKYRSCMCLLEKETVYYVRNKIKLLSTITLQCCRHIIVTHVHPIEN